MIAGTGIGFLFLKNDVLFHKVYSFLLLTILQKPVAAPPRDYGSMNACDMKLISPELYL